MIVAILSLPGNLIWAILALIFVCESHQKRLIRLQSTPFMCCCGVATFKITLIVLGTMGIIGGIGYVNMSFQTASFCERWPRDCPDGAASFYRGLGIFLIVTTSIQLIFVTLFACYISGYQKAYGSTPLLPQAQTGLVVQQNAAPGQYY